MLPAEASSYWSAQQRLTASTLAVVRRLWRKMGDNFDASWLQIEEPMLLAVLQAQLSVAERAVEYVPETLGALNIDVDPDFQIEPSSLVGLAGNGLPVDSLLVGAKVAAKRAVGNGATSAIARQAGGVWLETAVRTLLSDTGRASESLAIAVRPRVGYVRMMNPPSCSRCAVLAGKFYRYNSGFLRHPKCDCRHIPARENVAGDLRVDPKKYFDSLDRESQNKHFTLVGAQAIRDGADISQVVNARSGMSTAQLFGRELAITSEGTTRRGVAYQALSNAGHATRVTDVRNGRYFSSRAPRLMPESIYRIAENRDDALRLLHLNGYLADNPVGKKISASSAAIVGKSTAKSPLKAGGRKPPVPPMNNHAVPGDDDGEKLAKQLDSDYADWAESLPKEQRDAILRWQGADDRFYRRIQDVFRKDADDPAALAIAESLDEAIQSGVLTRDVVMWRGVRSTTGLFGVSNTDLAGLSGTQKQVDGFLAVSTSQSIAVEEFTRPPLGGGPALMRVSIRAGTRAAWVKLVGDPGMAYQRELLLADGHLLQLGQLTYSGDLPIIDVEVM